MGFFRRFLDFPRFSKELNDYQGFFETIQGNDNYYNDILTNFSSASVSTNSTLRSTTSSSYVTITGLSITRDFVNTEVAILCTQINLSGSDTSSYYALRHPMAGTEYYYTNSVASPNGDIDSKNLISFYTNLSGSVTFTTEWKRRSGTGTIYTEKGQTILLIFKR